MCVDTCMCACVCICVCMFTCTGIRIHMCMHAQMYPLHFIFHPQHTFGVNPVEHLVLTLSYIWWQPSLACYAKSTAHSVQHVNQVTPVYCASVTACVTSVDTHCRADRCLVSSTCTLVDGQGVAVELQGDLRSSVLDSARTASKHLLHATSTACAHHAAFIRTPRERSERGVRIKAAWCAHAVDVTCGKRLDAVRALSSADLRRSPCISTATPWPSTRAQVGGTKLGAPALHRSTRTVVGRTERSGERSLAEHVYVHVYVCGYVYASAHVYVFVYVGVHVYVYVNVYVHVNVCVYVY